MTAQPSGRWSRRASLRNLTLAGAAGVFGVYPRRVAPVESHQAHGQADQPSALGVCPQCDARAQEICPNCGSPGTAVTGRTV
jgi:hypothetical protein